MADADFLADRRLAAELEAARDASPLPEVPRSKDALNDLLVRLRLRGLSPRSPVE